MSLHGLLWRWMRVWGVRGSWWVSREVGWTLGYTKEGEGPDQNNRGSRYVSFRETMCSNGRKSKINRYINTGPILYCPHVTSSGIQQKSLAGGQKNALSISASMPRLHSPRFTVTGTQACHLQWCAARVSFVVSTSRSPVLIPDTDPVCGTCRKKSRKCDRTRPTCLRCRNHGLICEGYELNIQMYGMKNGALRKTRSNTKAEREARALVEVPEIDASKTMSPKPSATKSDSPANSQTAISTINFTPSEVDQERDLLQYCMF